MPLTSNGARRALLAGLAIALAVGTWLLRPSRPSTSEVQPQRPTAPTGRGPTESDPVAPPRLAPQEGPAERLAAFFERLDRDLRPSYEALGPASVPSGLLTPDRVISVAAFPDAALERYSSILRDPAAGYAVKLAALDALSVLARGRHPEVRTLYLSLLEKNDHPRVLEWAAAFVGYYYDGSEVQAALLRRALDGSPAAVEALSYSAASDLSGIRAAGDRHAEALRRASERVQILRAADARTRLQEILAGHRRVESARQEDVVDWAIHSAARSGYVEVAETIRGMLPRLGKKLLPEELENWDYWETQGREPRVAHAIQALHRLGNLNALERRMVGYFVLDGSRESAAAALEARRQEPKYRDLADLYDALKR
jgi:hypothetical protein